MSWLSRHRRLTTGRTTVGDRLLAGFLSPLAELYGLGVAIRSRLLLRHPEKARRWGIPVIGVGALAAGGSGKTPFAAFLANRLRDAGYQPIIIAHGYGARRGRRAARLLTNGCEAPRESWQSAGEESLLLTRLSPGIPVLIAPRRHRASQALRDGNVAADVAVLDGGFQDLRLHQDLRLLMLDASRPPGRGRLLPLGDLREPWRAMRRAQLLILHRAELCAAREVWEGWLAQHAPEQPRLWTRNRWGIPYPLEVGGSCREARREEWQPLAEKRLGVWSSIGRPESFLAGLRRRGIRPAWQHLARDHAPFGEKDACELRRCSERLGLDGLIVTEKDAVKMEAWVAALPAVYVVPARIELADGAGTLDALCEAALPAVQR